MKATWSAFATEIEAKVDDEPDGQRAVLTVRLTGDGTPRGQVGREIAVVLTKPMMEVICQVAMDTHSVYYVEVSDPSDELWRDHTPFARQDRKVPGL